MADNDYNVFKGPDDKWRAKRQGADRAAIVTDTQDQAFQKARDLAKDRQSEVSIHRGDNGQIRAKHSYGHDPRDIEG
ncbi:MAG: DUF2188 domain-containing protein [Marinobacterium sp.]|nr:DUF2188 domain-containing protein [Marinobacterium sp.]